MKYSIIMPCFKQENYVRETLDSVLRQKVRDWEILCTDDGSPDNMGKVLDDYVHEKCINVREYEQILDAGEEDKHPEVPKRLVVGDVIGGGKIRITHQLNSGLSASRNVSLVQATGEWLIYLDGDDLLAPCALEVIEDCMGIFPDADMIRGGVEQFVDGAGCKWLDRHEAPFVIDMTHSISRRCTCCNFHQYVYNRKLVADINFSGIGWNEERPYVAKCMVRATQMAVTTSPFYGYRVRGGSMSHSKMPLETLIGNLEATKTVIRTYVGSGKKIDPFLIRAWLTDWTEFHVGFIMRHLCPEDRPVAWRNFFKSLDEAVTYEPKTLWRAFTIRVCRFWHSKILAIILLYFPHWLKLKGIHR